MPRAYARGVTRVVVPALVARSCTANPTEAPRATTATEVPAAPAATTPTTTPAANGLAAPEPDGPPAPTTIAAIADGTFCATPGYVAPAGARPELRHRTRGAILELGLHNAGTEPVCMYVYIATHELQHDWLTVEYADPDKYHHASRTLRFDDDRDKSAPVAREIGPGATFWLGLDLQAWAARPRNGAEKIRSGDLYVTAIYDNRADDRAWQGRLERTFGMKIP